MKTIFKTFAVSIFLLAYNAGNAQLANPITTLKPINTAPAANHQKYKVMVKLVKAKAQKVIDADNNEDIFGTIRVSAVTVNGASRPTPTTINSLVLSPSFSIYLFSRGGKSYSESPMPLHTNGVSKLYASIFTNYNFWQDVATDLTLEEVRNTKFFITGNIKDKELPFDVDYKCKECNGAPREMNLGTYFSQIQLIKKGETKALKIGDDNFFELNFYENGDNNSSHVKFLFSIEVSAL